jgi:hypothetical protein
MNIRGRKLEGRICRKGNEEEHHCALERTAVQRKISNHGRYINPGPCAYGNVRTEVFYNIP